MASIPLFIGTYTRATSKGITAVQLDTTSGELSQPKLAAETTSPSYLALSPNRKTLYAVSESDAMAAGFRVGADHASLTPLPGPQQAMGKAPCHLVVDHTNQVLLLVNYHTGVVASLPISADGSLGRAKSVIQHHGSSVDPDRQSSAHAHSVTISPDNRYALVCDLGLDQIFTYKVDPAAGTLTPASPATTPTRPGSGPRHFAFSPDGRYAFVISEMGAIVTSYRYDQDKGSLEPIDTKSTLAPNFHGENKSAAIRVSRDGRFVYASNRGPDDIAVFSFNATNGTLDLVENTPTGGKGPRDFALSPDGSWLVAANQDSNSLTVFRVAKDTGRLTRVPTSAEISMPVCVLFVD